MNADALKPMWESLVVRGVAGILFGIAAVFWPALTLVTLVYIFSIYILVSGVVNVVESVTSMVRGGSWLWKLVLGVAELGVGLYLVRHPNVSFETFVLVAGLVLIARGVFEVVMAVVEDVAATEKTLMTIGGVLAVAAGIFILLQPVSAGVTFVWVLGLYALVTGPVWIALGVDAKRALGEPVAVRKRR